MTAGQVNHEAALVVVEGIDGAGTTSQVKLLVDWLEARGRPAAATAEPSRGPIGALLRQVLAGRVVARLPDGRTQPLNNEAIALLFAADRLDHLHSEVLPLLEQGVCVVCDRYYHSSLAYQGLASDWEWIYELNGRARRPEVTYLLDCPAEVALQRLEARRGRRDIYERLDLQRQLRQSYLRLPERLAGQTIIVVDATQPLEQVQKLIRHDLAARLGLEHRQATTP